LRKIGALLFASRSAAYHAFEPRLRFGKPVPARGGGAGWHRL